MWSINFVADGLNCRTLPIYSKDNQPREGMLMLSTQSGISTCE